MTLAPTVVSTASKVLDSLKITATALKTDITAFPGDPALVANLLIQDNALLAKIDLLKQNLPQTSLSDIFAVTSELETLREKLNKIISSFNGKSQTLHLKT